jgi:hypothetical protein
MLTRQPSATSAIALLAVIGASAIVLSACGSTTHAVTAIVTAPAPTTPTAQVPTRPVTRVIEHTHTVRETPKACIGAVHVAAHVFGIATNAIKDLGQIAPLVKEAAGHRA